MPERSFSVRLSADTGRYVSAMKAAETASSGFATGTERNLSKLGGSMQALGSKMTVGLSVPLVAAGGAAVKTALDFDTAFTQIVSLTGVTAGEVDGLKESVLDLAGETAQSPQELADALYFAASAGLDTAGAMEAVTVAAQASAVGMGSTTDVVGLVASAVAAYGEENINAAEATDILTAAVQEGRAEPDEMAAALGRVLPIAGELGISFDEVAGATAYLSNVFGSADETTVRFGGVLRALLDPSAQGRDALLEMGTSVEELRATIQDRGLLGALDLLRTSGLAANQDAMSALFADSRALQGALVLLRDESGRLAPTLEATANSTGQLSEALAITAESAGFKLQQAWAEIQTAMIQAGDIILPIVAGIAGGVADLAERFSDLPEPVQTAVIAFLGLVALAGPIVAFAGTVIKNLGMISVALTGVGAAGLVAKLGLAGVVAAVGIAAADIAGKKIDPESHSVLSTGYWTDDLPSAIFEGLGKGKIATREFWTGAVQGTAALIDPTDALAVAYSDLTVAQQGVARGVVDAISAYAQQVTALENASTAHATFQQMMLQTADGAMITGSSMADFDVAARESAVGATLNAEALAAARGWQLQLASATGESEEAIRDHAEALEDNAEKALAAADAWRAGVDATFALRSAQRDAHESILDLADAQANLIEVQEDGESTAADVERAYLSLADAQDRIVSSADGVADAEVRVAQERATSRGRTLDATAALDVFNRSLVEQAAQASGPTRQALVDHIATLNGIPPKKASELLALVDEGKRRQAINLLDDASKPRASTVTAVAQTSAARAELDELDNPRTMDLIVLPRLGAPVPRQRGGRVGAGEALSLVGEGGPELVSLPVGSFVHTASATAAMLGGIQSFQVGGVVRPSRSRALLRASAEAVLEARRLREQAEALELLAKATTNVDEREKLREDAAKLRDRAQDARTLAVEKAEAAADRYARAIQRESDELEGEAEALRRNADALRDEADAAVAAGEARAEALRGRAESLRQAFDAERQLADAQKARAEAQDAIEAANRRVMESNRQQTIAGVTTFVHGEEERAAALAERTEALERARDAALALADAQVQLARERAEVAGRRFTELDAARVLRASLARQGQQGLISALGIPQQMALLRQAGGAIRAGGREAADLRAQAKAVDASAKAVQQNSNALERFSNRLDRFNFARPINVVINTDKEITARQIERALRRAIT